jgi:Flp pilus assembly pilin Flp
MSHNIPLIRRLAAEDGQTTAEYGVVMAVITLAVLATMIILSGAIQSVIQTVLNILGP